MQGFSEVIVGSPATRLVWLPNESNPSRECGLGGKRAWTLARPHATLCENALRHVLLFCATQLSLSLAIFPTAAGEHHAHFVI